MTVMTVLGPRSDVGGRIESHVEHALDAMRYETRPYTIQLQRHARLTRFATRREYAETLTSLLGFYRPLDRWLSASLAAVRLELDLARRARAPMIRRDLVALDGVLAPVVFQDAPPRTDVPYALGWLYGTEVAALGGRATGKRLHDQLGITPESGGAFFDAHGVDTPAMCARLSKAITRRIADENELAAACAGAVDCFEALVDWSSSPRRAAA